MEATHKTDGGIRFVFIQKLADVGQLIKVRLSILVVFSAAMAYLWTTNRNVDTVTIWLLSTGGFLITGSANIFNQVIERKSDKLMKRTFMRPLPDGRMKVRTAVLIGLLLGAAGLFLLSRINFLSAVLGALAMIIYTGIYTPMKKISPLTIIPGAVAGSLPVVIGCVAASGEISTPALILFMLQLVWQFPHTWSIAWLLNSEYNKAGIKMLPVADGRSKSSAVIILISTFLIIPSGLLFYMYESAGISVSWLLALAGIALTIFAFRLYLKRTDKSAVGLMLGSFAYLPIVLIILVIEKFL